MIDNTDQASRELLPLDRVLGRPEEVTFFVRSAIYGVAAAIIYWFMTYEPVGTVLLGAFGVAAAALSVIFGKRTARHAAPVARGYARPPTADWPFGSDPGIAPSPTLAPLQIGFGALLAALTIAFGPAMLLTAVIPIIAGAVSWYRDASSDLRIIQRREDSLAAEAAARRPQRPMAVPAAGAMIVAGATIAAEPAAEEEKHGPRIVPRLAIAAAVVAAVGFVLSRIWRLVVQIALFLVSAIAVMARLRRSGG